MAERDKAGVLMYDGRRTDFRYGHPECDRYTLMESGLSDRDKGLPGSMPEKLLPGGQPRRNRSCTTATDCIQPLHHYVYQTNSRDIREI